MILKTKFYLFILLVGVILTAWALFFKNQSVDVVSDESSNEMNADWNEKESASSKLVNYLEGRLEKSDNSSRGNLRLVSSLGEIYIKTERDFNFLVGYDVLISINGTLENFQFLNMEKRFEKNGYIQLQ